MLHAAKVLDFYDDAQHELMTKVAMPTEISGVNATVLTPEQHGALPDTDFGLIILTKRASVLRKFPVNDPGNAWLSAQYFQQTHDKLAFPARFVAAKFIKAACSAYEVPASPRVDAYAARITEGDAPSNVFTEGSEQGWMLRKLAERELFTKEADSVEFEALLELPNEHFALVMKQGDGSVIRKYAMPDSGYVSKAATYFDKYAMDLPPKYRHQFAISVVNRAEELDVDVSDSAQLAKWAGADWNRHVEAHLEQRKSLLPRNPGAREILNKLAASLSETNPVDMAEALQVFDESTGLTRYYGKGVTEPYESVMDKTGSSWSDEIDGQTLTEDDLRKAAASTKLASYLGSSFASQFAKNPVEIFESLPSTEKILIGQISRGEA
jgi:hypothetical protein